MKKDQYFNLEVNLLSDDNIAAMMLELDAAEALGVYMVLLLHLRAKDTYEASYQPLYMKALARRYDVNLEVMERVLHDYHLFVVDEERQTFRSPYLDRVMKRLEEKWLVDTENGKKGGRPAKRKKTAGTPASKGQKPNETQENRIEENKSITTIEYNSSNTGEPMAGEGTAAVAVSAEKEEEMADLGEEMAVAAKGVAASDEKTEAAAVKGVAASDEKMEAVTVKVVAVSGEEDEVTAAKGVATSGGENETVAVKGVATSSGENEAVTAKGVATSGGEDEAVAVKGVATSGEEDEVMAAKGAATSGGKKKAASAKRKTKPLKIDWGEPPLEPVCPWEELVDQLPEYRVYMEQAGIHSGLGMLFIDNEKRILELFKAHICLYAKEKELCFLKDVKQYFSNFTAAGSITCRNLRETLLEEKARAEDENISRFEIIINGQRTYQGYAIPSYAPPRPSASVVWDDGHRRWCN